MKEFPDELVGYLRNLIANQITPRDIVTRDSIRNAMIVAMSVGGSTNVLLHAPEIARAAGYTNFFEQIMTTMSVPNQNTNIQICKNFHISYSAMV